MPRYPSPRTALAATLAACLAAAVASASTAGASTGHRLRWAPASKATVHPGVTVTMAGVSCRAGYLLTDGRRVFLAVPAACSGVSGGAATDGCSEAQVPLGLPATIQGARYRGRLVYSSFVTMQSTGVRNANECAMNDLSLVQLDRRDIRRANPSVPGVGGPTGTSAAAPATGDQLTVALATAAPGLALQNGDGDWSHTLSVASPVMATDLGAPVLTSSGRAVGMLSIVSQAQGVPVESGDLLREVRFLQHVSGFRHVHLATGTVPFSG